MTWPGTTDGRTELAIDEATKIITEASTDANARNLEPGDDTDGDDYARVSAADYLRLLRAAQAMVEALN